MEEINTGATWPEDWPTSRRILQDLGCLGGYLYHHRGGRSGKDHVVTRLARHGGHMTQRELQTSFDIRSGSMSDVLAKVEAAARAAG
ncbi:MAG: hypothetical protein ACI38Z_04920 [Parafannyhessea sp.]|uniref:hypothetical protein n=1 Tax=Parafannyhessea sp. TaxID=2847324 RepID=UPI003F0F5D60